MKVTNSAKTIMLIILATWSISSFAQGGNKMLRNASEGVIRVSEKKPHYYSGWHPSH